MTRWSASVGSPRRRIPTAIMTSTKVTGMRPTTPGIEVSFEGKNAPEAQVGVYDRVLVAGEFADGHPADGGHADKRDGGAQGGKEPRPGTCGNVHCATFYRQEGLTINAADGEMLANAWVTVSADTDIVFDLPVPSRFDEALGRLGIQVDRLHTEAGHA